MTKPLGSPVRHWSPENSNQEPLKTNKQTQKTVAGDGRSRLLPRPIPEAAGTRAASRRGSHTCSLPPSFPSGCTSTWAHVYFSTPGLSTFYRISFPSTGLCRIPALGLGLVSPGRTSVQRESPREKGGEEPGETTFAFQDTCCSRDDSWRSTWKCQSWREPRRWAKEEGAG